MWCYRSVAASQHHVQYAFAGDPNLLLSPAYVLSTTTQPLPARKYRMVLGVFAQFCRLVPAALRPAEVHLLWLANGDDAMDPRRSAHEHPIILVDPSIYVGDEVYSTSARTSTSRSYVKRTLRDLFRTMGPRSVGLPKPTCDCSHFIPAAWYAPPDFFDAPNRVLILFPGTSTTGDQSPV